MVRFALPEAVPDCAEMLTTVADVTACVVTTKDAVLAPWGTVTSAGTLAAEPFVLSCTGWPPAGALALSVTMPAAVLAPVRLVGFTEIDCSVAGEATVMATAFDILFKMDG